MTAISHADPGSDSLLLAREEFRPLDPGSLRPGRGARGPDLRRLERMATDLQIAGAAAMAGGAIDGVTGAIVAGGTAYAWSRHRYPEQG